MTDLLDSDGRDLGVKCWSSAQRSFLLTFLLLPNLSHELGAESALPRPLVDLYQSDRILKAHLHLLLELSVTHSIHIVTYTTPVVTYTYTYINTIPIIRHTIPVVTHTIPVVTQHHTRRHTTPYPSSHTAYPLSHNTIPIITHSIPVVTQHHTHHHTTPYPSSHTAYPLSHTPYTLSSLLTDSFKSYPEINKDYCGPYDDWFKNLF